MQATFDRAPRRLRLRRVVVPTMLVLALLVVGGRITDLLPSLGNPFSARTVDRSTPALLHALEDVHEYHAATARFQVVVDVERDVRYVPSLVSGERTVFLATGEVDANVDFSELTAQAVTLSADRRAATIRLPAPVLGAVRVLPEHSRVVSRDRGVLDRIGSVFSDSPTGERRLYLEAERKLAVAAQKSGLTARAQANTRVMLEQLARSLGVESVTVEFAASGGGTSAQARGAEVP